MTALGFGLIGLAGGALVVPAMKAFIELPLRRHGEGAAPPRLRDG